MQKGKRIVNEKTDISYGSTLEFFNNRAEKFTEENPYSVTMYQDSNPGLVEMRNAKEVERLLPLLKLNKESRILDIACGIGRWSDAINNDIKEYCGIDFSEGLIELARKRNADKENRHFIVGHSAELKHYLKINNEGLFNRILIIGGLVYLNDADVERLISQVEEVCESEALICIREPIGISNRLTLTEFFSEELKDNYNAIYRTREELMSVFEKLLERGFELTKSDFLFLEEGLNNRKETSQYFFIFERKA